MRGAFVIGRDARGSIVHVRRRDDGECVGCIEVGLYEIVRAVIVAEVGAEQQREAAVTVVARGGNEVSRRRTDRTPASDSSVFRRYEDRAE